MTKESLLEVEWAWPWSPCCLWHCPGTGPGSSHDTSCGQHSYKLHHHNNKELVLFFITFLIISWHPGKIIYYLAFTLDLKWRNTKKKCENQKNGFSTLLYRYCLTIWYFILCLINWNIFFSVAKRTYLYIDSPVCWAPWQK